MTRALGRSNRWQAVRPVLQAAALAVVVVLSTAAFTMPGQTAHSTAATVVGTTSAPIPVRFKTMVSKQAGWALSATNQVLRTINGGKSWTIVSSAHDEITPIALSANTAAHALLIGAPSQNRAAITWTTSDAGRKWQMGYLAGAVHATGALVDWFSPRQAWMLITLAFSTNQKPPAGYPPPGAMGFENVLYHTTDGGGRWTVVRSSTVPDQVDQMIFTTPFTGWMSLTTNAIGPNIPLLAKTISGGKAWRALTLPRPPLLAPHSANPKMDYAPFVVSGPTFANPQTGALLTTYGALNANGSNKPTYPVVYFTTDGGAHWQWILLPPQTNSTDSPAQVVWQRSKTGWLLNVLDRAGTVLAEWQVVG